MERWINKDRVRAVAERQAGRITWAQLRRLGVSEGEIRWWIRSGYLVLVRNRVYALGHQAPSEEGRLWEATLYAGPGASLTHTCAAWWRGLIEYPPRVIQVTTPRQCASVPGIEIHARRRLDRVLHRGMPVTTIPQTLLDLAADGNVTLVRKALGRLDYRHELDPAALLVLCRPGNPGSTLLRWAIVHYDPRFGRTNGPLEDSWLWFCEREDVPKPDDVNVRIYGVLVDAVYLDAGLVIELDGVHNHGSAGQKKRDHTTDLILRGHGLQVNRYCWNQVHADPRAVRADVLAALQARRGWKRTG